MSCEDGEGNDCPRDHCQVTYPHGRANPDRLLQTPDAERCDQDEDDDRAERYTECSAAIEEADSQCLAPLVGRTRHARAGRMEGGRAESAHEQEAEEQRERWRDRHEAQKRRTDDDAEPGDPPSAKPVSQRPEQRLADRDAQ